MFVRLWLWLWLWLEQQFYAFQAHSRQVAYLLLRFIGFLQPHSIDTPAQGALRQILHGQCGYHCAIKSADVEINVRNSIPLLCFGELRLTRALTQAQAVHNFWRSACLS